MSQSMSCERFKQTYLSHKDMILFQVTSILVASKYDEIDDNITTIHDLIGYQREWLSLNGHRREMSMLVPDFDQIVACEKRLLNFFEWDLKFLLPIHFLRLYLANGVLFSKEMVPES